MEINKFGDRIVKVEDRCGRCWDAINNRYISKHCSSHHKIIAHILNEGDSRHYYPLHMMKAKLYYNMDTKDPDQVYTVRWQQRIDVIPNEETTTE